MKLLPHLLALLLVLPAACSKLELPGDEPEEPKPPTEEPGTRGGDAAGGDTVSVGQAIAAEAGRFVTVRGYIVGYKSSNKNVFGTPEDGSNASFLLADAPDETDNAAIIVISLGAKGSLFREELNLYDHPEYLYRRICVTGVLEKYYNKNGIKELLEYDWADDAPEPDDPPAPDDPGTGGDDGQRTPGLDDTPQTVAEGR